MPDEAQLPDPEGGLRTASTPEAQPADLDAAADESLARPLVSLFDTVPAPAVAPNRQTRTVGVVKITADQFTDLGGGLMRASGRVFIGDYLVLIGAGDSLVFTNSTLTATNVTLALQAGEQQLNLFTGSFSAGVGNGLATLGGGTSYLLSKIAGFNASVGLAISQINLVTSAVTGSATLRLTPPGINVAVAAGFTLAGSGGGITTAGTLQAFSLPVAGATIAVPAGATLSNAGVQAPLVTLTLPAALGGLAAAVSNLQVTPNSLSLGGANATFNLPNINFGDGSRLRISDAGGKLALTNGKYELAGFGTLRINLPGNQWVLNLPSFKLNALGNLSATVGQFALNLAGASLTFKNATLSQAGVSVQTAMLTLPASLGGATGSVGLAKITKDGLAFAAATIPLPEFKLGGGNTLKLSGATATMGTAANGYTLAIGGKLQVRLPGNQKDLSITGSMSTTGAFSATVSALSLNIATLTLALTNATVSNTGLSVASAMLTLPAKLGGSGGTVTNVSITAQGLQIGGGTANITIPNFKIGSASGFSVTNAKAKIEITNNGTAYKVTLTGTVAISIPGSNASAAGSISVNSLGAISGSINSFSLALAGLTLSATNIQIKDNGALSITAASLKLPSGFGGGGVNLNNVTIKPGGGADAVSIGGGSFQLPEIKTGGFTLQVSGSLVKEGDGYMITANGIFKMPSLGGAVGCSGIKVGVKLYATPGAQAVLEIEPAPQEAQAWAASYTDGLAGLELKEASLSLDCSIPIGNTGFFLTSISGKVTLTANSTTVSVGLEIAAGKKVNGVALASVKGSATVVSNPFELALSGAVKVFTFTVAGAGANVKKDQFYAKVWIDIVVLKGQVEVWAWSDYKGFHLAGKATAEVGIPKGAIVNECFTWVCCPNGSAYNGFNCAPWKTSKCQSCLKIPGQDWKVGNALAEVGEFTTPSNTTVWGLKGKVTIAGYTAGFYVDTTGKLKVGGDVDKYKLVTPVQMQAALARLQAARAAGLAAAAADWTDPETGLLFTVEGEVQTPVRLEAASQVVFGLTRFGSTPGLELIRPDGVRITPTSLPAGVRYSEVVTLTAASPLPGGPAGGLSAAAAGWDAPLGQPTDDLAPEVVAQTTVATQALILANRFASRAGLDPSVRPAIESETSAQATTPTARLRLVHAVAGVGPVSVLVNGAPVFSNISFGAATPYVTVPAGDHTVSVVLASATGTPLVSRTVTLAEGADYTAVAAGASAAASLFLLADDNARPAAGKAAVRLVNASRNAPALDLSADGELPILFDVAYGGASEYAPLDAGRYALQVRRAGFAAPLVVLPDMPLVEGRVYTVFVMGQMAAAGQAGVESPAALQAVVSQDAAPPGRVRFVHGVESQPALNLLADGVSLFSNVPFLSGSTAGAITAYAELAPGQRAFAVTTPGGTTVATLNLDVQSDRDYTLVATPGLLWSVADDNTLPGLGQTRIRLLHAWSDARTLDLAIQGGSVLIRNVGRRTASSYITLPAGTYNLEVRDNASGRPLVTLTGESLREGMVHTVVVRDSGPRAEVALDQAAQRTTQLTYEVDAPARGEWRAVLTNTGADDQYVLSVTGNIPAPVLSDVTATPAAGNTAQVSWRLVSTQISATVSIFANPGPIETTLAAAGADGPDATLATPLYAGFPLTQGLTGSDPAWINGTPQSRSVSLNDLPSGTYRIWVQADDRRGSPARAYATTPVVVSHPWAATWNAALAARPAYRSLAVTWSRHPNPDVDRYVLKLGTQPGVAEQEVNVGDALAYTVVGLNPGQAYTLWLEAVDDGAGRVSASEQITATPLGAGFTLTGPAGEVTVRSGAAQAVALMLATTDPAYPDGVTLVAGCELSPAVATAGPLLAMLAQCQPLPAGISVIFDREVVTPTVAGVQVNATISTTAALADGVYTVPIEARGGGVERRLDLRVRAQQPAFRLTGPAGATVTANGSVTATIGVTAINAAADPVDLALADAPEGLEWRFAADAVAPGGQTSLRLTDTSLLPSGRYPLRIVGSDGRVTATLTLTLTVREPAFLAAVQPARQFAVAGRPGVSVFALDLAGQDGWTTPVTLSLAAGSAPPDGSVGLSLTPTGAGGASVTVTPPGRAYLLVTRGAGTPLGLYVFVVQAQGDSQTESIAATLEVVSQLKTYLPLVMRR